VRGIVLGDAARDDHQITDLLKTAWLVRFPVPPGPEHPVPRRARQHARGPDVETAIP
jgi:hypothetical protein